MKSNPIDELALAARDDDAETEGLIAENAADGERLAELYPESQAKLLEVREAFAEIDRIKARVRMRNGQLEVRGAANRRVHPENIRRDTIGDKVGDQHSPLLPGLTPNGRKIDRVFRDLGTPTALQVAPRHRRALAYRGDLPPDVPPPDRPKPRRDPGDPLAAWR